MPEEGDYMKSFRKIFFAIIVCMIMMFASFANAACSHSWKLNNIQGYNEKVHKLTYKCSLCSTKKTEKENHKYRSGSDECYRCGYSKIYGYGKKPKEEETTTVETLADFSVAIGEKYTIELEDVNKTDTFKWFAEDNSKAGKVLLKDEYGSSNVITGIAEGTTYVTIQKDNKVYKKYKVIVKEAKDPTNVPICEITLSVNTINFKKVGDSREIARTIYPKNATNQNVNWSTSDARVATVNQYGSIRAVGTGSCSIIASDSTGTVKAYCLVRVGTTSTENPTLSESSLSVKIGSEATVSVEKIGGLIVAKWYSQNSNIASVTGNGSTCNIKGNIVGNTQITCVLSNGKILNCKVEVKKETQTQQEETHEMVECKHKNKEWQVTIPATCSEKGEKSQVCKSCGKVFSTKEIAKLDHKFKTEITKEATCSETGIKVTKCINCGYEKKTETIKKTDHKYKTETTKEATCSETGTKVTTCTYCGYVKKTETIRKKDHNFKTETTKEATCTEAGTKITKCTYCGKVKSTSTIKKLGHDYDKTGVCKRCQDCKHKTTTWVVTKAATCKETGIESKTCSVCKKVIETRTTNKSYHKYVNGYCSYCGKKQDNSSQYINVELLIQRNKKAIGKGTYSEAEWTNMENELKLAIEEGGGKGTKGGLVAAAEYLASLEYRVPYSRHSSTEDPSSARRHWNKIGLNHNWGTSSWGLDCTGFVGWAFKQVGLSCPGAKANIENWVGNYYSKIKPGDVYYGLGLRANKSTGKTSYTQTHIALVIEVNNEGFWIAESTTGNIQGVTTTFTSFESLKNKKAPRIGKDNGVFISPLSDSIPEGNIRNLITDYQAGN